ncbi:Inorganic triphosphatase YgiF, contains CYTH and CHAD domains [Bradyrhizobium erythrophlei]|uniref:Inorganic triphosphatase YgiF, contains CYTH and CHAD domains n=2 Tax=Bradyrhizobium erythrophlei TaxID=1437360 RepID=A0A1M7U5F4_9BRAD|nr:Inorganic triphosphatase YgiF, contains CYTH and CHAD domains [Bradyrhizobium erythrophlei]
MAMNIEPELKFRLSRRKLASLANGRIAGTKTGPRAENDLVSTYYDTKKHKLRRHGLTLRVRRAGDEYVQTIKAARMGSFARSEWEEKVESPAPDFRKTKKTPVSSVTTKKSRRKMQPVFKTSVRRITRPLNIGSSQVELAVDRGDVSAGRRSSPIAEFEVELKRGRTADLFRLARNCQRKTGGELDLRSKSERGYRLADGDDRTAARAEPIQLRSEMTVREAFHVIAYSTLRHLSSNADGVRSLDSEAVHQMRVGLRRLRAAISLFKSSLPGPSTAKIKTDLKWLTNQLAPAREIDVLLRERIRPLRHVADPQRGARAVEKEFADRREKAFRHARKALQTDRYRDLPLDVLEWLETRRASERGVAELPVAEFVVGLFRGRLRKVRKEGRDLENLSASERHKLRIKIKKLRYAVGFFESLYADAERKELARFSGRLKKLQEALGALNDFIAHRKIATDAALNAPSENRRARAFASGVLIGQEHEAAKKLMNTARREFERLKPLRAKPD